MRAEDVPPNGTDNAADELRLALVLNGGTSLAVWMGGAIEQIDALRCAGYASDERAAAEPPLAVYARLLRALRLTVRVDIVAGTSAGGINGALLATAVRTQRRLAAVRDLWLGLAQLGDLVQDPDSSPGPRSILQGEARMLPGVTDAIAERLRLEPDEGLVDLPASVRLIITGTDIAGVAIPSVQDSFQDTIELVDHRVHFRFACGENLAGWCPIEQATAHVLGRAARTSASFPFAFEPSRVDENMFPLGTNDSIRTRNGTPAFAGVAAAIRWMIDGGALDNSPIVPVLNEIEHRAADETPVRRTLVFVIPYTSLAAPAAVPATGPPLRAVVDTTFNLPRDVPAIDDLMRLSRYLGRRDDLRRADDALQLIDDAQIAQLANSLFPSYRQSRIEELVALIALKNGNATAEQIDARGYVVPPELAAGLDSLIAPLLPPGGPTPFSTTAAGIAASATGAADRGWGGEPLRRAGRRVLDRIREARATLPTDVGSDVRRQLRTAHAEAQSALAAVPRSPAVPGATLTAGIEAAVSYWGEAGRRADARAALVGIAGAFTLARRAVAGAARPLSAASKALLLDRCPFREGENWAGRLLATEVITQTVTPRAPALREPDVGLRFMRLSADATAPDDVDVTSPRDKLYGLRLGHFAGFASQAWRANDWMWGRLDAASRLVDLLLDESRIREAGITEEALQEALGGELPPGIEGTALPAEERLTQWRARARAQLHQAIIAEEIPAVRGLFGDPRGNGELAVADFGAYVAAHNGASRIDEAVRTTLSTPPARALTAQMIQDAARMASLPWTWLSRPAIRTASRFLARKLVTRL